MITIYDAGGHAFQIPKDKEDEYLATGNYSLINPIAEEIKPKPRKKVAK